jgi:hypothetical protein
MREAYNMPTITITSIDVKPKRRIITTSEGRKLGIWADKLAKLGLETGASYDVETTDAEVNGVTLTNIVGTKRLGAATSTTTASPAKPTGNGYAGNGNGNAHRDRQIFVQGVLQALIKTGHVGPDKVLSITRQRC